MSKPDIVLTRAMGETLAVIVGHDGATLEDIRQARQVTRVAVHKVIQRMWESGIVRPIQDGKKARTWAITSMGQEVFSALCKVYRMEAPQ